MQDVMSTTQWMTIQVNIVKGRNIHIAGVPVLVQLTGAMSLVVKEQYQAIIAVGTIEIIRETCPMLVMMKMSLLHGGRAINVSEQGRQEMRLLRTWQ